MTFQFSHHTSTSRERRLQRVFEILPGALSWTILIGMALLGWVRPLPAAILIIAFDLYWLLRLFYSTIFLILSSTRLSLEQSTNWMARVHALDDLADHAEGRPPPQPSGATTVTWRSQLSQWLHERVLQRMRHGAQPIPHSNEIYHLVIFPIVKETQEILEPGVESLLHQTFPSRQMVVVLAVEERAGRNIHLGAQTIQRAYRERFLDLLIVTHPDGLPGEAKVKGANVTYAAKAAADYFTKRAIPFERILVSCFDADTVVNPEYMACLSHAFLTCPQRTRASFQPIPVYYNNIWDVPGFARVLDIGSSFFQLIEATNPDTLVTFSSHSMSFKALVDVGYWPVDLISDDSAIFWKALIHFNGDYRVVPLYITVSMDVAAANSWWETITNVYQQKRRWAWGVENFPIVMRGFLGAKQMKRFTRLRLAFKLVEGHLAWATWPFLLTLISWFPALFAGREFSDTVLYYSAPRITTTIFHLASLSLLTTITLSYCLLPKAPGPRSILKRIGLAFEWLMVPVISIALSAIPALDAQTRLMRGHYMEFWVTKKTRGGRTNRRASHRTESPLPA